MNKEYFNKATDSTQYDSEGMNWKKEGIRSAPTRQLPQEYLEKYIDIKDQRVLDIGCGMGQLFDTLKELAAKEIVGIEPSRKNVEECKLSYPDVNVIQSNLEDFQPEDKFDAAIAVYVFEHIADLSAAYQKVSNLLVTKGFFYLIHVDSDYAMTPRFDYQIAVQKVDDHTIALETKRSVGLMYDLVRPVSYYIQQAESNGFMLKHRYEMKPTPRFLEAAPRYALFADKTISHLLVFQKKD